TEDDLAVLNGDDESVREAARGVRARRAFFTLTGRPDRGAWVRDGHLMLDLGERGLAERICETTDVPLRGRHNLANVLAASIAAASLGVGLGPIARAIRAYRPQRYVLQKVAQLRGVAFINDSKATNEAAAAAAQDAVEGPVRLFAGGSDKGCDFSGLAEVAARRVKAAFLIGECAGRIAQAFEEADGPPYHVCSSLRDAVQSAWRAAESGDTVLLSPACASFDQFRDYADRGEQFTRIVEDVLAAEGGTETAEAPTRRE
ncbi:MAG: glutamate ligase domain-containing protein, partial [Armatimonadota bacterium]